MRIAETEMKEKNRRTSGEIRDRDTNQDWRVKQADCMKPRRSRYIWIGVYIHRKGTKRVADEQQERMNCPIITLKLDYSNPRQDEERKKETMRKEKNYWLTYKKRQRRYNIKTKEKKRKRTNDEGCNLIEIFGKLTWIR